MKRKLALLLCLCLSLTALAAMPAASAETAKVTLRFAPVWGMSDENVMNRDMLAQFQKDNPDINIVLEDIAGDEMKNKIRVDVAANNEPDVWQFWPGCVCKEYAKAGILANVDEYLAKSTKVKAASFSDTVWAPCTFDGQHLALPRMGASAVMMINKSIFEKYGQKAPTTWDEFMAVGKVFRDNGVTPLNVGSKLGNPSHFWYNELVCQYASGVQDVVNLMDDTKVSFKTDAMTKAAKLVQDMRDAGMFAEDTLGQTGDWAPATAYYDEGRSAMCYTLSWEFASFSKETLANSEIIPFPTLSDSDRKESHLQGTTNDCWCISARSWADPAKQDAIVRFLDFLMADMTLADAQKGYLITVDSELAKQVDTKNLDTELMTRVLDWRAENNTQVDPMIWQSLPTLGVQTDYCNALDELWAGTISADDFIAKCQASVDDYLDQ